MTTPKEIDLIISAAWIIPVVPKEKAMQDSAIAVDQGKIIALGSAEELHAQYQAKHSIDMPNHALIPGLINMHGHAAMTLMRGYADDKPLMEWLEKHIWPAEMKWVSEQFVHDGTELAAAEMIAGGTTCFSDMYFFPEQASQVAHDSGMRAQINFPIMDFPTAWGSGPDEYLSKGQKLHAQYQEHPRIDIGFGPHAPYTVSDEPLLKIVEQAEKLDAKIQIHLHETASEVEQAVEKDGKRPTQRLHELGVLSTRTQCVHMTQIDESDIEILQQSQAHIVHCPESNLKLASGICPSQKLLNAGVNVCLGTDGAASNNDLDMLGEMRTAAFVGKISADDAAAVNASTALEMATINGAIAMGLEDKIGSLEVGKEADIVAIDLSDIAQHPIYNPISHIAYTQLSHRVTDVWVAGVSLLENGVHTTLDINAIKNKAKSWQEKLMS